MNPRNRSFLLPLLLAGALPPMMKRGEAFYDRDSGEDLTPPTFTPEMRVLVLEEMERLKIVAPDLNAKARKKAARKAVLSLVQSNA